MRRKEVERLLREAEKFELRKPSERLVVVGLKEEIPSMVLRRMKEGWWPKEVYESPKFVEIKKLREDVRYLKREVERQREEIREAREGLERVRREPAYQPREWWESRYLEMERRAVERLRELEPELREARAELRERVGREELLKACDFIEDPEKRGECRAVLAKMLRRLARV